MEQKTFPAFGYIVTRNIIAAGEVINDRDFSNGVFIVGPNFRTVWIYSKGLINNIEVNTGQEFACSAGYNNIQQAQPAGLWRAEVLEPTVVFCLPPDGVNNVEPPLNMRLTYFSLSAGQSTTLPQGTKLCLFAGELQVGSTVVQEMRQVEFKSGAKTVVASKTCYGAIFP